jgi:hypothetical protein
MSSPRASRTASPPATDDDASTLTLAPGSRPAFSVRVVVSDSSSAVLPIVATVLVSGSDPLETVRIELSSETDLFFLFDCELTEQAYEDLRSAHELSIEFEKFPKAFSDILSAADSLDGEFKLQWTAGTEPVLTVQQNLRFKTVTIFQLQFSQTSNEALRDRIQARYNEVRTELAAVRGDLLSVYSMLKIKNPSVLKQVSSPRK